MIFVNILHSIILNSHICIPSTIKYIHLFLLWNASMATSPQILMLFLFEVIISGFKPLGCILTYSPGYYVWNTLNGLLISFVIELHLYLVFDFAIECLRLWTYGVMGCADWGCAWFIIGIFIYGLRLVFIEVLSAHELLSTAIFKFEFTLRGNI